jgi:CHAD domain-containing protein
LAAPAVRNKWIDGTESGTPLVEAAMVIVGARLEPLPDLLRAAIRHADEDPEHIHRLRVSNRRAEAALSAFRGCFDDQAWRRVRKHLRRLRRAAGTARTCDVHGEALRRELIDARGGFRRALEYAENRTRKERRRAQKEFLRVAERHSAARLTRDIRTLLDTAPAPRNGAATATLGRTAADVLPTLVARVEELAEGDLSVLANLHALRIAAKRLRYASEVFAPCFGPDFRSRTYAGWKNVQDHLGSVNDDHEMIIRIHGYMTRDGGRARALRNDLRGLATMYEGRLEDDRRAFLVWWEEFRGEGGLERLVNGLDCRSASDNGTTVRN